MASAELQNVVASLSAAPALSVHNLAAPLLATDPRTRSSTSSNPTLGQTPEDYRAELTHYKDLFSKLRFNYTEQVTKERFLRALVASPTDLVAEHEVEELEHKLVNDKAALKTKKQAVQAMLQMLEGRSVAVAELATAQASDIETLAEMPGDLDAHRTRLEELRALRPQTDPNPLMNMSRDRTNEMLDERTLESQALAVRMAEAQAALEAKARHVAALEAELADVEERKRQAIAEVTGLKRQRGSGQQDQLEMRGRWCRAAADVLRATAAC